eukprot:355606-Chlamydomonas_euryale.AAC.4
MFVFALNENYTKATFIHTHHLGTLASIQTRLSVPCACSIQWQVQRMTTVLAAQHWQHSVGSTALTAQYQQHSIGSTALAARHWKHSVGSTALATQRWQHSTSSTALDAQRWQHSIGSTALVAQHWQHSTGSTALTPKQLTPNCSSVDASRDASAPFRATSSLLHLAGGTEQGNTVAQEQVDKQAELLKV